LDAPPLERRAWVRYGSDLQAAGRAIGVRGGGGWTARVCDLSAGGIGLFLHHRFKPGTPLLIELTGTGRGYRRTVRARVVYATAIRDACSLCWRVGCALVTPLSDEELRALS
jgi:hypothetical protein